MVAITNDNEFIYNANQFIDWLGEHGLDKEDLSWLILDMVETTEFKENLYKQIHDHYDMDHPQDGLIGDAWIMADEAIRHECEDIDIEISNLRQYRVTADTRRAIADRLEIIVDNLSNIL